jgi:site-specific DNA-methyltransferase (adenine-specific)
MMLSRTDIPYIKHFDDASKIFGNSVDIKGGVSYFLKDSHYDGPCNYNNVMLNLKDCDILIESKYLPLITKMDTFAKLNSSYRSKGYFEIPLTDKRLHDAFDAANDVKCYVSQMKGSTKYIKRDTIKAGKFGHWQIITPSAAHGAYSGFGNLILGRPDEVYSETYISFTVKSESEANSLLTYMKCRLPNMMLSLRKISQNISNNTCNWIPLPPLDREWTDAAVYKHFSLSDEDIKLITETKIMGYKDTVGHVVVVPSVEQSPMPKKIKPKRFLKIKD